MRRVQQIEIRKIHTIHYISRRFAFRIHIFPQKIEIKIDLSLVVRMRSLYCLLYLCCVCTHKSKNVEGKNLSSKPACECECGCVREWESTDGCRLFEHGRYKREFTVYHTVRTHCLFLRFTQHFEVNKLTLLAYMTEGERDFVNIIYSSKQYINNNNKSKATQEQKHKWIKLIKNWIGNPRVRGINKFT